MPLLEVIAASRTAPSTVARAVTFGRKMGKTVVVVADRPGFWVNRILTPYLNEAGRLLSEGVDIETLDTTMTRFGFPVGPITLLDEVGFDVAVKAARVMHDSFGERMKPASGLERLVDSGRLGRKNGAGFYRYARGMRKRPDSSVYSLVRQSPQTGGRDVADRLVFSMLNEAARAFEDTVVRCARDGDIGAIFGIGYPPFRGGPFRFIDALGAARVVDVLNKLADAHGERFQPATVLRDHAKTGRSFHPAEGRSRA